MYKQFSQGSKDLKEVKIFTSRSRRTIIKANFYTILSKTSFFSANEVSFSLGGCSFMRIEYQ